MVFEIQKNFNVFKFTVSNPIYIKSLSYNNRHLKTDLLTTK